MKNQALIQYIDSVVGGRKVVPLNDTGRYYSVPCKFQGWQAELWSLNVELISSFDQRNGLYRAEIEFLADNAPVEVLKPNAQFALYEGTRIVAVGVCV